jgi:hypothetical protein
MINFSGTPALVIATANIRRIVPSSFTPPFGICAGQPPYQIATGTENDDYDIYIRWAVGNSWVYATPTSTSSSPTILARMRGTTNLNSTNNYQRGVLLQGFTDSGASYCTNSSAFNNNLISVPISAEGPDWKTQNYANATYDKYNFYIPQDQIFKKIYIIYKIYTTTLNGITYYGNVNLSQTAGTSIAAYNFWKKGTPPSLCCPNNLRIKYITSARFENNVADTTAFESNINNFNDVPRIANRGLATLRLDGCLDDLGYLDTSYPFTVALGSFVHSLNWELADSVSYKGNNVNYTSLF